MSQDIRHDIVYFSYNKLFIIILLYAYVQEIWMGCKQRCDSLDRS